ncbi:hypothetical protein NDU88_003012 [Pleurodeles waltl]|uniref:Uncharacterized protein n=1 Tax=Pleurodeles waltl TaxID=8319 RepID=A0AAV7T4B2_PLEWA|nr:hypothetical protein NDU88_003012 [Pleurodeles waltl]
MRPPQRGPGRNLRKSLESGKTEDDLTDGPGALPSPKTDRGMPKNPPEDETASRHQSRDPAPNAGRPGEDCIEHRNRNVFDLDVMRDLMPLESEREAEAFKLNDLELLWEM